MSRDGKLELIILFPGINPGLEKFFQDMLAEHGIEKHQRVYRQPPTRLKGKPPVTDISFWIPGSLVRNVLAEAGQENQQREVE